MTANELYELRKNYFEALESDGWDIANQHFTESIFKKLPHLISAEFYFYSNGEYLEIEIDSCEFILDGKDVKGLHDAIRDSMDYVYSIVNDLAHEESDTYFKLKNPNHDS